MANIFEFLSKDGNITPEKTRKLRQNSVCLGSSLSMRSFAIEEPGSPVPALYATLSPGQENTPWWPPLLARELWEDRPGWSELRKRSPPGCFRQIAVCFEEQGGITCGAIKEATRSSNTIDKRVIINFCDKIVAIASMATKIRFLF